VTAVANRPAVTRELSEVDAHITFLTGSPTEKAAIPDHRAMQSADNSERIRLQNTSTVSSDCIS
jgi:hypothetical protein